MERTALLRKAGVTGMEEAVIFWGENKSGSEILLGAPLRMEIKKDRGAADMLTILFPAADIWENIRSIYGYRAESHGLVFSGLVDEQTALFGGDGIRIEMVARSLAALLIDNEVMPQTIRNPSLAFISRHFLEPLGLRAAAGDMAARSGELVIKKGTSVMSLMNEFCRVFLGTEPYVTREGLVYCGGSPSPGRVKPDRLLSWEISEKNCEILSEVWAKNSKTGGYSARFVNPLADGIVRRRYTDKPGTVDFSVKRQVRAAVPGFVEVDIFDRAELPMGITGTVTGVKISGGNSGFTTFITAEENERGDGYVDFTKAPKK